MESEPWNQRKIRDPRKTVAVKTLEQLALRYRPWSLRDEAVRLNLADGALRSVFRDWARLRNPIGAAIALFKRRFHGAVRRQPQVSATAVNIRVPAPPPLVLAEPLPLAVVLNLEGLSLLRSQEPPATRHAPRLQRRLMDLSIRLPLGSEPGRYEVRLGRQKIERQAKGTAVLRNGTTTLRVRLDLRTLGPGLYDLATRREGESWHFYRVVLK
jgi:hypothetical protein